MKVFEEIKMYFFNFELRPSLSCEVPVSFVFLWSSLDRGDLDTTVNRRIKVRFVLRFTTNAKPCEDLSALFSSIFFLKMQSLEEFLHILYQWQWLPVLTVLLVTYVTYYLFHVVQKPRLIGKEGPFREFLLQSCPMVGEYYWPTFWCFGARAQTVIRAVIRSKPSVPFRRYFFTVFSLGS